MANGAVTQIDASYLNKLQAQLQQLEGEVEAQLRGIGSSSSPDTTNFINPVNSLVLLAGPPTFNAGAAISNALKNVGGSVYDQLKWLDKVLKDMIQEITTTVSSFNGTESLNNQAVDKLMSEFQGTINDLTGSPNSSSSNPNTSPANPNTAPAG